MKHYISAQRFGNNKGSREHSFNKKIETLIKFLPVQPLSCGSREHSFNKKIETF
ncbi:MAG: hypothetical protein BAJALOKI1v1_150031 [Promethearchaeota archaeon]|nr:MAG: hypothetical protein BAJALOKI1v1_150031 [Candidatus Lokiarchaeota archaeon]